MPLQGRGPRAAPELATCNRRHTACCSVQLRCIVASLACQVVMSQPPAARDGKPDVHKMSLSPSQTTWLPAAHSNCAARDLVALSVAVLPHELLEQGAAPMCSAETKTKADTVLADGQQFLCRLRSPFLGGISKQLVHHTIELRPCPTHITLSMGNALFWTQSSDRLPADRADAQCSVWQKEGWQGRPCRAAHCGAPQACQAGSMHASG